MRPRRHFKTKWFELESVPFGRGGERYFFLRGHEAVAMVAQAEDGRLIMVRQFRPAVGCKTLELPAGAIDAGETAKAAARRELLEETGYDCRALTFLGRFHVSPSRLSNKVAVFFCSKARKTERPAESGVAVVLLSPRDFERRAREGKLNSAVSLGLYYLAKERGLIN